MNHYDIRGFVSTKKHFWRILSMTTKTTIIRTCWITTTLTINRNRTTMKMTIIINWNSFFLNIEHVFLYSQTVFEWIIGRDHLQSRQEQLIHERLILFSWQLVFSQITMIFLWNFTIMKRNNSWEHVVRFLFSLYLRSFPFCQGV